MRSRAPTRAAGGGGGGGGDFTHFLSIPLAAQLGDRYLRWRAKAGKDMPAEAQAMFVEPASLHITLQMLSLPTDAAVDKAKRVIADCAGDLLEAIENRALVVTLRALGIWDDAGRDTLSAANVVFIKVDFESDAKVRLQKGLRVLQKALQDADLLAVADDCSFHVTVLNRKASKDKNAKAVDVRRLIADNQRTVFGQHHLLEVHLAKREKDATGAYVCCGKIELPKK
jgi:2'-5' RNA ligase